MDKKLIVFDYDNTLKPKLYPDSVSDYIFKRNLNSISRYKQIEGNYFMLATARPYFSIKEEIDKYKIKPDFISCMRGYTTYNSDGEIITTDYLDKNQELDIEAIKLMKCVSDIEVLSNNDKVICYLISLNFLNSRKELRKIIKENDLALRNYIHTYLLKGHKTNKLQSVEFVRNYLNIDKKNVYTFGDDVMDKEMIKTYNGYSTITPYDLFLLFESVGNFFGAYSVVDKITDNKAKIRTYK